MNLGPIRVTHIMQNSKEWNQLILEPWQNFYHLRNHLLENFSFDHTDLKFHTNFCWNYCKESFFLLVCSVGWQCLSTKNSTENLDIYTEINNVIALTIFPQIYIFSFEVKGYTWKYIKGVSLLKKSTLWMD